jgi:hypothetical protein
MAVPRFRPTRAVASLTNPRPCSVIGEDERERSPTLVPAGVDAQRWLGFERRIQERRLQSLLEAARVAIRARDPIAARLALEEARELRPAAPEVQTLAALVASLPATGLPRSPNGLWAVMRPRALGAAALLVAGIALHVGLDSTRGDTAPRNAVAQQSRSLTVLETGRRPTPDRAAVDSARALDSGERLPFRVGEESEPPTRLIDAVQPERVTGAADVALEDTGPVGEPVSVGPALGEVPSRGAPAASEPLPGVPRLPRDVAHELSIRDARTDSSLMPGDLRPAVGLAGGEPDSAAVDGTRGEVVPAGNRIAVHAGTLGISNPLPHPSVPTPDQPARPAPALADTPASAAASGTEKAPLRVAEAPVLAGVDVIGLEEALSPADEARVAEVLDQYVHAYRRLDASAAREIYPAVDERALTRAFSGLASQHLMFHTCDIDVQGTRASASCRGEATYVAKVGSREERVEPRLWRFELRRNGEGWQILQAEARHLQGG